MIEIIDLWPILKFSNTTYRFTDSPQPQTLNNLEVDLTIIIGGVEYFHS